jgi:anhydro-N-acetylmuramic acid kinase
VKALLARTGAKDADLIGFHGQTISHAPERGHTCQIGDGALLARLTGIKVVSDFRTADVKAGGQGAPLVPVYHQAIAADLSKPLVFLNIGGVSNVTYVDEDDLIAFDTGPGNALLDDWMLAKTGRKFDSGGAAALKGKLNGAVLSALLSHAFFSLPPPKSLDRDAFASGAWAGLSTEDGAATLSTFTVRAIGKARDFFPRKPLRWIVCGGGRHNAFFMGELRKALGVPVEPIEKLGLDGDATEAEAFAYLAARVVRGLPLSFPGTTGVKEPMQGGVIHDAAA